MSGFDGRQAAHSRTLVPDQRWGKAWHVQSDVQFVTSARIQSAIRANVATLALLQPSPEDARMLADAFAPLTERDLFNLPRFRMAIRTELDGETRIHHRCAARAAAFRLVRCRPAPQRRARRSRP
ncbi:MAG: hypothetical protein H0V74_04950, partial [Chloroflexi bacterium]|nr:hypothetical protein [Chloroflexota bacterium]